MAIRLEDFEVPFVKARVRRQGADLTVITYGNTIHMCLEAAEKLAGEGYDVEVIDLRSIVPLDEEAILNSIKKTNRCLVVHEDKVFGGFGGELLATFAKKLNGKFVFVEKDGGEIKYAHVYRRFHQAQARAELTNKIRFHDLRHSFASNYMMNGGNVFDLQKLLGHTKIDMTMRYAHFSPNHLQGSLRFMNMVKDEGELSVVKSFIPFLDHEEKNVMNNLMIMNS